MIKEQKQKRIEEGMRKFYEGELDTIGVEKYMGVHMSTVRKKNMAVVDFDTKKFLELLQHDYITMTRADFSRKHGIQQNIYPKLKKGYEITPKFLIAWLKRIGFPYELNILQTETLERDNLLIQLEGKPATDETIHARKQDVFTMTPTEKEVLAERLEIVLSQKEHVLELLRERNTSAIFVSRVEDRLDTMLRHSLAIGVELQRIGQADKALYAILKKEGMV